MPPSRLPMLAQAVAAAAGVSGGEVALTDQELTWARQAGAALASARGRSLLTVGRFAPPQLHSLRIAGEPGTRKSRQDLRHRAAAELRARCRRIVPGPRTRHPRAEGRGAVRTGREPDLSITRRHRLRQALRDGAAARARRHARRRDSGAQQLAPADGSCARGLERRSLAGRSCDHHPAARPAHVRQSLGARGTGRPDVGSRAARSRDRAADLGEPAARR